MKVKIFGYTVEVYISRSKYGRKLARELLLQASPYTLAGNNKIALIKALRIQQDITLVDAKKAIEDMFDFVDGKPVIK